MSTLPSIDAFVLPVVLFLIFWALFYKPLAGLISVVKESAKSGAAWIARSRVWIWSVGHSGSLGSYAPILLVIAVGAIAAIGAGFLFAELVEQVPLTSSVVYRADQAIHTWFGHERQPAMTTLFETATNVGGTVGQGALVAVVAAMLLVRKQRTSAIFVAVTAGTGALLNLGLKMIFERTRPDLATALIAARWYSFPSGHAMDSFITFGTLAYLHVRWLVRCGEATR
jgi:hypothetical protein